MATIAIALSLLGACQSAARPPEAREPAPDPQAFISAFNQCDQGSLAQQFDPDGAYTRPDDQTVVRTASEVVRRLMMLCTSKVWKLKIWDIALYRRGDNYVAIGTSSVLSTREKFNNGKEETNSPKTFSISYRRAGERWLIVEIYVSFNLDNWGLVSD